MYFVSSAMMKDVYYQTPEIQAFVSMASWWFRVHPVGGTWEPLVSANTWSSTGWKGKRLLLRHQLIFLRPAAKHFIFHLRKGICRAFFPVPRDVKFKTRHMTRLCLRSRPWVFKSSSHVTICWCFFSARLWNDWTFEAAKQWHDCLDDAQILTLALLDLAPVGVQTLGSSNFDKISNPLSFYLICSSDPVLPVASISGRKKDTILRESIDPMYLGRVLKNIKNKR